MSLLVEICAVIVTMSIVAIAVATMRTLNYMRILVNEFRVLVPDVRRTLARVDALAEEAQAVIAPLKESTSALQRLACQFEALGGRAALLTSTVMEEVETPVFTAVLVARAVRNGAAQLFRRFTRKFNPISSPQNGGHADE